MRRKRLQHCADILCHMFCGWRLIYSYQRIVALGSGTLKIDALTRSCFFQTNPVLDIPIAGEIHYWLMAEFTTHHIDPNAIVRAELTAELQLSTVDAKMRDRHVYYMDQNEKPIKIGIFHRLAIDCNSEIATDEKVYHSTYSDIEVFPLGWPET